MSKANQIRKKALDLVRKQNWEGAIREFRRLAEIDRSNPNVFNELGDVYLKTGNRTEAYEAFQKAIDAYTRVSLYNNAVAVCKKVLRLLPARYEVLVKLGVIRAKQGLWREAESYFGTYLDKIVADPNVDPEDVGKRTDVILEHAAESEAVLEKLADSLTQLALEEPLGRTLAALYAAHTKAGHAERANEVRQRLVAMGMEALVPEPAEAPQDATVITEDNIWDADHSDGERIQVDTSSTGAGSADPAHDYGAVELGAGPAASAASEAAVGGGTGATPATATGVEAPPEPAPASDTGVTAGAADQAPASDATQAQSEAGAASASADSTVAGPGAAPTSPSPAEGTSGASPASPSGGSGAGDAESIAVSAILGEDEDDDGRNHYDLGMAYTEMELWADAIREFQAASNSPAYRARALEMIGHCFIQQGQARLAIKRLEMGLREVSEERDAIGIKYNLGLAYEMVGDTDRARAMFEDVYVIDVSFRDVAAKMRQYGA